MNTKHFFRNAIGTVFSLSLLLGIACMTSATAQAQYPYYGQDRDYRRDRDYERDRERRERERQREREREYRRNQNHGDYNNGGYDNGYYGYNNYSSPQSLGYRDGYAQGDSDAAYGRPYNPTGGRIYRDGTEGYNSYYGNKGEYKRAFQQAFLSGYQEAFQRRGGNRRGYYGRYPY